MEARAITGNAAWVSIGSVCENEPPGSITSKPPYAPREVFVFGWYEGGPGVWRSIGGVDVETAAVREITSVGFELLADLRAGAYEREMWTRRLPLKVRFRLSE